MKNKVQIVVLGVAVLLIWSLVVYRFFDLKNPDSPQAQKTLYKRTAPGSKKDKVPFEYHMNYSEPFAVNQKRDLNAEKKAEIKNKALKRKTLPKNIQWPKITYIGTMSSSVEGEKDSYFVEIDEKTETLTSQDSIHDLKILQLTPDSVWFEKEKEKKAYYIDQ